MTSHSTYRDELMNFVPIPHHEVADVLNEIRFESPVDRDQNRIEDALFFREVFFNDTDLAPLNTEPVSLLEVLVALFRRGVMLVGSDFDEFDLFRDAMAAVGFDRYEYDISQEDREDIIMVATKAMKRDISYDGLGGWFPLEDPPRDQRTEELWYQFMAHWEELEMR